MKKHAERRFASSQVRSGNYLCDRVKETAGDPMCMLLGADMFRIPSKIDHICQYMKLPVVPADLMPPPPGLPALLVINLQVTATPRDLLSCRLALPRVAMRSTRS